MKHKSVLAVKLLSISKLRKTYGATIALNDASLDLNAGETLALMGENGAGKSTLIKILAGTVAPDSGEIHIDGQLAKLTTPISAHRLGLIFIHQELNVIRSLDVAENIFLGRPYPQRFGLVNWREIRAQAQDCLKKLGIKHISPEQKLSKLSVGDRMLVKIAAAFLEDPAAPARIFVMDEPTAALASEETERLFKVIDELKRRACGIIYVSHRLDEVLAIADRISVLRDGAVKAEMNANIATKSTLIEAMIGRDRVESQQIIPPVRSESIALSVNQLNTPFLRDVSFNLHAGEILGVVGLAGSGPEFLIKGLINEAKAGTISLNGEPVTIREAADAWKFGIAIAPRERRSEGLVMMQDIASNIALPHLNKFSLLRFFLSRKHQAFVARKMGVQVRLKARDSQQKVRELSGGNQQKVMFARAIAGDPSALLLDEPTRGVDVGAKYDIYALLREIAEKGVGILIVSSDHEEIIHLCSRIMIFKDGRLVNTVVNSEMTEQALLALCYGESQDQIAC